MITQDAIHPVPFQSVRTHWPRGIARTGGFVCLCGVVALSAIVTKEAVGRAGLKPLASVTDETEPGAMTQVGAAAIVDRPEPIRAAVAAMAALEPAQAFHRATVAAASMPSPDIRYFNARPVRPARTITMLVTAYSPDARSCGPSADGITSSVHSVQTNAMRLVAADSRVLPLGSMISLPGYDDGRIVPVLDRGGKIKGKHLDALFPTDAEARRWGARRLEVTIWEYADNAPADDFRAIRDSRR